MNNALISSAHRISLLRRDVDAETLRNPKGLFEVARGYGFAHDVRFTFHGLRPFLISRLVNL